MKKILEKLADLINVKTMVTLAVMVVFVVLTLTGAIGADNAMIIISMVVSFYFGTQHQKKDPAAAPTTVYTEPVAVVTEQTTPVTESVDNATYNKTHPDSE